MTGESRRPIAGGCRASESESAHDGGGEEPNQIADHIAQELRDSGLACEVVNFVPTEAAVLRRDRIVVSLALILLTALAWSYLLWLSVDMDMAGWT
jgi:ABC-type antimicrobial peptide transport system ATPase subunit